MANDVLPTGSFNDRQVNFFLEELYPHADSIYRFSFALTLNPEIAQKNLETTFKEAVDSIDTLMHSPDVTRVRLLRTCWEICKGLNVSNIKTGQSPIAKALEGLSITDRAIVTLVDVIGLSSAEALGLLEMDEKTFRSHQSQARRQLLKHLRI